MRLPEFCLVLLTFFSLQIFNQDNLKQTFVFDSTQTQQQNISEELKFKNLFKYDSKKRKSLDDFSTLKLFNKVINDSSIFTQSYYLDFSENDKDQTEDFKESFRILLEYAKQNHYKYDLGKVGKSLGISRKILAIILAIISVAKYSLY